MSDDTNNPPRRPERLLPPAVVMDRTSLSYNTIKRAVRKGEFPAPVQIGARRIGWSESSVAAWIASKLLAA